MFKNIRSALFDIGGLIPGQVNLGVKVAKNRKAFASVASAWAYRCLIVRGESASNVQLELRRNEKAVTKRHPAMKMLTKGIIGETQQDFMNGLESDLNIFGFAIVRKITNEFGRPQKIERIKPAEAEPEMANGKSEALIVTDQYGERKRIPANEIMMFENYDPRPGFGSLSPVEVVYIGIENSAAANMFLKDLLDNYGIPPVFFTTEQGLKQSKLEMLYEWYQAKFGTPGNRHKVAFGGWGLKPVQLSVDPDKMAIKDIREVLQYEICAAFGVPPGMAGMVASTNRSDREVQRQHFWEDVFMPHMDRVLAWMSREIFGYWGLELKGLYERLPVFRADILDQAAWMLPYWRDGLMTNKAVADRLGLRDGEYDENAEPRKEQQLLVNKHPDDDLKEFERAQFRKYCKNGNDPNEFEFHYIDVKEAKGMIDAKNKI